MKKPLLLVTLLLLCLLLGACGAAAPAAQEAAQTPAKPESAEALPTPEPTPETVHFPDGTNHPLTEETLDLSGMSVERLGKMPDKLARMPALRYVNLGAESEGRSLPLPLLAKLVAAVPKGQVDYRFTLFGKELSTLDEQLDFNHIKMTDEGETVRALLPCMKNCRTLDMDFCGVSSEAMARIRDENPQMEVVWRIWFGSDCSVRTDVERILASSPQHNLTIANTRDLQYCTKVRLLDIGHSEILYDYSFLASMPELEVCIIGISGLSDLSPIAGCTKLEYLEINTSAVHDLAPLKDLKNLKHLNMCYLGDVYNWEVLCGLTSLERLWIGAFTKIPEEGIEQLRAALPNTEINTTELTGCGGSWREIHGVGWQPRYALLREQFEYDAYKDVCACFWNDPKYKDPNNPWG